LWTD